MMNILFTRTIVKRIVIDLFLLCLLPVSIFCQEITVRGKITSQNNESLPGVTIVIKGTSSGTVSNHDGDYILPNVSGNTVLVFSFVGMHTQEILVGTQTTINVVMEEESIGLDEVIAIGYGTVKRSDLTG